MVLDGLQTGLIRLPDGFGEIPRWGCTTRLSNGLRRLSNGFLNMLDRDASERVSRSSVRMRVWRSTKEGSRSRCSFLVGDGCTSVLGVPRLVKEKGCSRVSLRSSFRLGKGNMGVWVSGVDLKIEPVRRPATQLLRPTELRSIKRH